MSEQNSYNYILTNQEGNVGIVQLNRPKALNALQYLDQFNYVNQLVKK